MTVQTDFEDAQASLKSLRQGLRDHESCLALAGPLREVREAAVYCAIKPQHSNSRMRIWQCRTTSSPFLKVQHLDLQPIVAIQAVDPTCVAVGDTAVISLNEHRTAKYARIQQEGSLAGINTAERERWSKAWTIELCSVFRRHGFHKAGLLQPPVIDIDEILASLQHDLTGAKDHLNHLEKDLADMSVEKLRRLGDEDFTGFVEQMKDKYVRHLFSRYASDDIDGVFLYKLVHYHQDGQEPFPERKRVRDAFKCLLSKYAGLWQMIEGIEKDWRPGYLLSDQELANIKRCPGHALA